MLAETLRSCRGCLLPHIYVHLNVSDLSPSDTFSLRLVKKHISRIFPGELLLLIPAAPVSLQSNEPLITPVCNGFLWSACYHQHKLTERTSPASRVQWMHLSTTHWWACNFPIERFQSSCWVVGSEAVHVWSFWRLWARGARRFVFWKGWWDGGRQGVLLVWQLARNSGDHQLLTTYHCLSHRPRHTHWHTKYKFIAKHLSRSAKLFSNFICIFQIVKFKVPHCGGRTVLLAKIIGIQRHHNLDLGGKHIREYSGERQAERKD